MTSTTEKPPLDWFECCGVRITAMSLHEAADEIALRAAGNAGLVVHLCNAYTLSLAARDGEFRDLLNRADLNLADGTPLAWFGALLDRRRTARPVPGPALMASVFRRADDGRLRHFLLGSSPATLEALERELGQRYPHAGIVGAHSPAYTSDLASLADEAIRAVAGSSANLVWIGLGTPKQDWVAARVAAAAGVVAVPVGAAFDFISGTKREAPGWLRGSGFEWLFRLATEPHRLWRRYLVNGPIFLLGAARSLREHRRTRSGRSVPAHRRVRGVTPAPGQAGNDVSVLWCAPSFGYGGDLMYFRPIFQRFVQRFPRAVIPVDGAFPSDRYPELPLRPMMSFREAGGLKLSGRAETMYTPARRLPTARSAARLISVRADVYVLLEFTPIALLGFLASKIHRARALVLVENDPRYRGSTERGAMRLVKRYVARHVDQILASNEEAASYLRGLAGDLDERLTVGAILTSAPPATAEPAAAPAEQPGEGPVRFLFMGSVIKRKGVHELVAALAALHALGVRDWRLEIVGAGAELDPLRRWIERGGLAAHVRFHGPAPYESVWAHYAGADVVVVPSLEDYRSLASIEAVTAGRPAVLSIHDGAAEEIRRTGAPVQVIDPLDPVAFQHALARYVTDREFLRRALRDAREPPECLSVDAVVGNLERAVLRAAG